MHQILDRLWLTDMASLSTVSGAAPLAATTAPPYSQERLLHWAVLTLCEAKPALAPALLHIHAPIPDEVYLPRETWCELLHTLTKLLQDRYTVVVHCRLGVSRSPALVAAYLAHCGHSHDPQAALVHVVARRGCVAPHVETWRGVLEWFAHEKVSP